MKTIPLTQGYRATLDDSDYEVLSKFKWCVSLNRGVTPYAVRRTPEDKIVPMHRVITGAKKGEYVDHISGDTLDNRRVNLRICTNRENVINSKRRSDNTSGYRGVIWSKQKRKWQAVIMVYGHIYHLGFYLSKEDAAHAYDDGARFYFKEFARLNFPKKKGLPFLGKAA